MVGRFIAMFVFLAVAGCADLRQLDRDVNTSISQMTGTYTAPLLAGSPRPSRCSDSRCKYLDEIERGGYEMVWRKEATYSRFVEGWYRERRRAYPDSNDDNAVYEFEAFQKALAEQIDAGRISDAQWAYLVERKLSEIRERKRSGFTKCNTTNVGSSWAPNYQTICR